MNKIALLVLSLSLSGQVYSSLKIDLDDFCNQQEEVHLREELKNQKEQTMHIKGSKPVFTRSTPNMRAMSGNQPQKTHWLSQSSLEKLNKGGEIHLREMDMPQIDTLKWCSDFDTLFNDCKEEPGTFYAAHQRTALAYARRPRSHQ